MTWGVEHLNFGVTEANDVTTMMQRGQIQMFAPELGFRFE